MVLRHLTLRNTLLVLVVTLVSVNVGSHVAVQSAIAGYTIGSERYEQLALTYEHNSDIALLEGALNRIELELALVLDPRVPPVERDNHLSRIGRLDRDIHTMFLVLLDEVTSSASHESLAEAYRLYQSSALTRNVELIPAFLQGDDATARRLASELRSVALTEFSDHIRRAERMSLARLRDEEQSLILDHERLVGVTWWVVGLAGALALGVALFLVASITQPLNQLLRGMQGLAESHWKHRFADRGVGELAEIGRGLNGLTETVRAHLSSLDEAHGRFRALVDANPNPLILVNLDGTIQQVNPAVEHIFGYAEDELVGQPVELLLPDSVRAGHVALREGYMARPHVRTMGRDGLTLQGKCKDGRLIDVEASLAPLIVDGQQQFLA